ncbi:probable G-protein coupled receptor Mth-like 1 isoform X2 [Condylostylus longicornis]|uniref:probable G-protein coupled receptor Mth-like 1 isoform X2 n=1 Tax=Condylostylus longicornis TaxID=2530218 RepID=UPI00244DFDC5|nr:probable G-protein coupled receptor Mth-like 1 isoform X2 [Condylostylus longicornis]
MYKMKQKYLIFSIVIILMSVSISWSGRPSRVEINKCCPLNEHLNSNNKMCAPGNIENWIPKIHLMNRKIYYEPQGYKPQFIDFIPNKKPENCSDPKIYTSPNIVILSNGSLFLQERSSLIDINNYCADKGLALVCLPYIAKDYEAQIRKCCGPNLIYNIDKKTCYFNQFPSMNNFSIQFNSNIFNKTNIEIIYGFPECAMGSTDYHILDEFSEHNFNLQNASLILKDGKRFLPEDYCLESTISDFADIIKGQILSSYPINIVVCTNHKEFLKLETYQHNGTFYSYENNKLLAISICLLISVLFLIATLSAGFLLPPSYHALHWRCQMYYVSCLLVGDFLLGMGQLFGSMIQGTACVCVAIFIHFSFLAAFFWLNVMCLNIWWTFRDFRPTTLERNQEKLRLIIYSIYAWGGSVTIAGVAAILDQLPDDPNYNFLRPRFGEHHCWFYGDMEKFAYFFGPIGILLLINLALFASTAQQLTCGLWKMEEVKSTNEKSSIGRLCLKLVIVMGVTWIADIISWLVGADGPTMDVKSYGVKHFIWYGIWYIMDFINALQGVFIFIVVACQPQVWSAIKRIWSLKSVRGVAETNITHQHHSNSSHGMPSIGEVTNHTCTNLVITKIPLETLQNNAANHNQ